MENTSTKSISMPSDGEIRMDKLPDTFAQYKMLVSTQLDKKYQDLIKIYQTITQEPEFQALLNTVPSSADKVKRFETTYEKAGRILESFAVAVELFGSALLPEASLKMKYRAMVAHKGNQGLRDRLQNDEANLQANVQILYQQAKEVALRYNIPVEIIDEYLEKEDYVSMDKLVMKDKKCKHGLRYNPLTGQIKCIRKREVQRKEPKEKVAQPSCYQRRKNDCDNTEHCTWEVGKRCKSKAKVAAMYNNAAFGMSSSLSGPTMNTNPLYRRIASNTPRSK